MNCLKCNNEVTFLVAMGKNGPVEAGSEEHIYSRCPICSTVLEGKRDARDAMVDAALNKWGEVATETHKVNMKVMPTVAKAEIGVGAVCLGAAALAMSPVLLLGGAFLLLCGKSELDTYKEKK